MVKIEYSIVNDDCDQESFGKEGFFRIYFNENFYGEFYSKELQGVMFTDSVFDWFKRILKVVIELKTKDYVILSDIESFDRWIEFDKRNRNTVVVGIIRLEKQVGMLDIEYKNNPRKEYVDWNEEFISYEDLKNEVCDKARLYCNYLKEHNCKAWEDIDGLIVQL